MLKQVESLSEGMGERLSPRKRMNRRFPDLPVQIEVLKCPRIRRGVAGKTESTRSILPRLRLFRNAWECKCGGLNSGKRSLEIILLAGVQLIA